mmetsp:Transcript_62178/g.181515  ORF Transcript_62178/g.181515 Transcript_62178/m.181515 type:complete len:275 (-) Transcript_62178:207-1031(-)
MVLTCQEDVGLERVRCKPEVRAWKFHVLPFLAEGLMEEWEYRSLPEGVAGVHQLVGPPLKAAFQPHLPVSDPVKECMQVEGVRPAHDAQGSQPAVGIAAVSLQPLLACDAPFVRLAPTHILRHSFHELVCEHVEHGCYCDSAVSSSHISFTFIVHHEASARRFHAHEKLVSLLSVNCFICFWTAGNNECSRCSVSGRKMCQLTRPTSKAPVRVLAVPEKRSNLRGQQLLVIGIQHLQGMRNPEDEPRPGCIEASKISWKLAKTPLKPCGMEISI